MCTKRLSDDDYPDFGEVSHILVYKDAKYLVLKEFETVTFSHHYFAYQVEPLQDFVLLSVCDLAIHQVFHKYCIESRLYVVVKSCDHVELLI